MEKRGRALDANESHAVLVSTATRKSLVSWFEPFYSQMLTAIESRKKQVILGGRNFDVREYANGEDYVFMVSDGFVPMTRITLSNLRSLSESVNAFNTN